MPQVWGNDPLVGVKTRDLVFVTCHSDPYFLLWGGISGIINYWPYESASIHPPDWFRDWIVSNGAKGTQNEDEDEESHSQVYKISVWAPRASQAAKKW